jgi:F0F1-type ATP synthase epsilon subunit
MSAAEKAPSLHVIARAPFHVYYDGSAQSLSAENKVGKFDILPRHADFFSLLKPCDVVIITATEEITFPIHTGMLTVRDDEVMLFVNM